MEAMIRSTAEIVEMLLDAGCDASALMAKGTTCFNLACTLRGSIDMLQCLLRRFHQIDQMSVIYGVRRPADLGGTALAAAALGAVHGSKDEAKVRHVEPAPNACRDTIQTP